MKLTKEKMDKIILFLKSIEDSEYIFKLEKEKFRIDFNLGTSCYNNV